MFLSAELQQLVFFLNIRIALWAHKVSTLQESFNKSRPHTVNTEARPLVSDGEGKLHILRVKGKGKVVPVLN
jgi:hypothetical protein